MLRDHYPRGVRFVLNERPLEALGVDGRETAAISIRMARRRKAAGAGYVYRAVAPLPEDQRGIAVSTFGKVIKRGWDWLGITPVAPDLVGGMVEVAALAECLTLNKADFIRAGARGATYLTYRKAIQEATAPHLARWGQSGEPGERTRRRAARPVERDLGTVLADLADDFPLLARLVEQRAGGQRRLRVATGGPAASEDAPALLTVHEAAATPYGVSSSTADTNPDVATAGPSGASGSHAASEREREAEGETSSPALAASASSSPATSGSFAVARPAPPPGRVGRRIGVEQPPHDPERGRHDESTGWGY
jgi:hypothetical protein